MQYEIDIKLGAADQVGLRLRCESQFLAEKIHLLLRQENLKISRLMPSNHPGYTHFVYVCATESHLHSTMTKVEISCQIYKTEIAAEPLLSTAKTHQTFKSWQTQFRQAVKKLNSESLRPISSTQEINPNRLSQEIALGRTTEVEEQLLRQTNLNDSTALRSLIALYAQTEQHEQIIELCKAKRDLILALPISGRLVEQLVSAHVQHSQQTQTPELLRSAQQIAQEFLPELERLRQANGVRQLLHQALNPQELPPTITGATLNEQLAKLLEIEPGQRISQLESLRSQYPKATNVLLTLAESYTAIGNSDAALKLYQSILEKTEEIQQRYLSLLLESGHFQDVLSQLPQSIDELSPPLSGLRGVALYYLGQKIAAREFLEKAWNEGQRSVKVLLPLARLWAEEGDPVQAGTAYQMLQESADDLFKLEDYALMARVANLGGFGDLSDEQKVNYYEKCIIQAGSRLLNFSATREILKDRLELWLSLQDVEGLLSAYADWLDWLAQMGYIEELEQELAELLKLEAKQRISHQQHFQLLEGIEAYVDSSSQLRQSLANDYFGIALKEIDRSLRQAQPEAPFFEYLQRALLNLNQALMSELVEYRQQKHTTAQELGIKIISVEESVSDTPNLSSLKLALVGGHEATRREVIREFSEHYRLTDIVEVPPSSDEYLNRQSVQTKILHCDLIAMITGYMGHNLSQIVLELKKDGAILGEILPLSCRGKSGVVREILTWWSRKQQND